MMEVLPPSLLLQFLFKQARQAGQIVVWWAVWVMWAIVWAVMWVVCLGASPVVADSMKLAATTTIDNSGLLNWLVASFEEQVGIDVRASVHSSGAAFVLAKQGNVDVLLVHDPPREKQFIAEGWGIKRESVFYNHFVLVGAAMDSAGVRGAFLTESPSSLSLALQRIHQAKSVFISRGDESGTHQAEKSLWHFYQLAPWRVLPSWYLETGSGMGATLNIAASLNAYTISDTATWDAFKNKRQLVQLSPTQAGAKNIYSVIVVNPMRHGHLKTLLAKQWASWLSSDAGQKRITSFRVQNKQVFFTF